MPTAHAAGPQPGAGRFHWLPGDVVVTRPEARDFDPSKHPREADGRFGDAGEAGATPAAEAAAKAAKYAPGSYWWGHAGFSAWQRDLSKPEKAAIAAYTEDAFTDINGSLRDPALSPPSAETKAQIKALDSALAKSPGAPTAFRAYRSAASDDFDDIARGDVIEDKAFMSTSTDPKVAAIFREPGSVFFAIDVPKGAPGAFLVRSARKGENEYLLPRGSKLRVRGIERDEIADGIVRKIVHCDLLPPVAREARFDGVPVRKADFQGIPVWIENEAGSLRPWKDPAAGRSGATRILVPYGYIPGFLAPDGDSLDAYLCPWDPDAAYAFVVRQMAAPGYDRLDEEKVVFGAGARADAALAADPEWKLARMRVRQAERLSPSFPAAPAVPGGEAARLVYMAHHDDPRAMGAIVAVPMPTFRAWLLRGTIGPDTLVPDGKWPSAAGAPSVDGRESEARRFDPDQPRRPDGRWGDGDGAVAKDAGGGGGMKLSAAEKEEGERVYRDAVAWRPAIKATVTKSLGKTIVSAGSGAQKVAAEMWIGGDPNVPWNAARTLCYEAICGEKPADQAGAVIAELVRLGNEANDALPRTWRVERGYDPLPSLAVALHFRKIGMGELHADQVTDWLYSSSAPGSMRLHYAMAAMGVPGSFPKADGKAPAKDPDGKQIQAYARKVYAITQASIANRPKNLTLFRGVRTGRTAPPERSTVDIATRPVSSWSSSQVTAQTFANKILGDGDTPTKLSKEAGAVLKASVPRTAIYASDAIYGFNGESEFIVLGASGLKCTVAYSRKAGKIDDDEFRSEMTTIMADDTGNEDWLRSVRRGVAGAKPLRWTTVDHEEARVSVAVPEALTERAVGLLAEAGERCPYARAAGETDQDAWQRWIDDRLYAETRAFPPQPPATPQPQGASIDDGQMPQAGDPSGAAQAIFGQGGLETAAAHVGAAHKMPPGYTARPMALGGLVGQDGSAVLHMHSAIHGPDGEQVGEVARGFEKAPDGTLTAVEHGVALAPGHTDAGIEDALHQNALGAYRKMGASQVRVENATPAQRVGYARLGYNWTPEEAADKARELRAFLVARGLDGADLASALRAAGNPPTAEKVAALAVDGKPLGEQFLAQAVPWRPSMGLGASGEAPPPIEGQAPPARPWRAPKPASTVGTGRLAMQPSAALPARGFDADRLRARGAAAKQPAATGGNVAAMGGNAEPLAQPQLPPPSRWDSLPAPGLGRVTVSTPDPEAAQAAVTRALGPQAKVEHLANAAKMPEGYASSVTVAPHQAGGAAADIAIQRDRSDPAEQRAAAPPPPVGDARIRFGKAPDGSTAATLERFRLDPAHQGKNVGHSLLHGVLEEMRASGADQVKAKASGPAKAALARFGFRWDQQAADERGAALARALVAAGMPPDRAQALSDAVKERPWHFAAVTLEGDPIGEKVLEAGPDWTARFPVGPGSGTAPAPAAPGAPPAPVGQPPQQALGSNAGSNAPPTGHAPPFQSGSNAPPRAGRPPIAPPPHPPAAAPQAPHVPPPPPRPATPKDAIAALAPGRPGAPVTLPNGQPAAVAADGLVHLGDGSTWDPKTGRWAPAAAAPLGAVSEARWTHGGGFGAAGSDPYGGGRDPFGGEHDPDRERDPDRAGRDPFARAACARAPLDARPNGVEDLGSDLRASWDGDYRLPEIAVSRDGQIVRSDFPEFQPPPPPPGAAPAPPGRGPQQGPPQRPRARESAGFGARAVQRSADAEESPARGAEQRDFHPDEARDPSGKWTAGAGGEAAPVAAPPPQEAPAPAPAAKEANVPPPSDVVPPGRKYSDAQLRRMAEDRAFRYAAYHWAKYGQEDGALPGDPVAGMAVPDRLAFYEQAEALRLAPTLKITIDGWHKNIPPGLDDRQLRAFYEKRAEEEARNPPRDRFSSRDRPATTIGPDPQLSYDHLLSGLTDEQQKEMADALPAHYGRLDAMRAPGPVYSPWTPLDRDFRDAGWSVENIERASDALGVPPAGTRARLAAEHVALYGRDYEMARKEIFDGWAATSGTATQRIVQDAAGRLWNEGHALWKPEKDGAPPYSDRMLGHLRALKAETEAFYKAKFAKKKDPDPDLAAREVEIIRGVGGHPDTYAPAGAESWTTDKRTVDRFGKQMGKGEGYGRNRHVTYSALATKATYADALWTWESAAGKPGWPPEAELKGKKEIVLLGGRLKHGITIEHREAAA